MLKSDHKIYDDCKIFSNKNTLVESTWPQAWVTQLQSYFSFYAHLTNTVTIYLNKTLNQINTTKRILMFRSQILQSFFQDGRPVWRKKITQRRSLTNGIFLSQVQFKWSEHCIYHKDIVFLPLLQHNWLKAMHIF